MLEKQQEIQISAESYDLLDTVCLKRYLHKLKDYDVLPVEVNGLKEGISIRKITKIVYEKDTFFPDKLCMLLGSLHSVAESVFIIIKCDKGQVNFYLGVNDKEHYSDTLLESGLNGFFPGIITERIPYSRENNEIISNKIDVFFEKFVKQNGQSKGNDLTLSSNYSLNSDVCVASVSGVASLKDDQKKSFIQGIENLINGAKDGGSYTAVLIADSVNLESLATIRNGYEQIYSSLFPLAEYNMTYSQNHTDSMNESLAHGITKSVSVGASETTALSQGISSSVSKTSGGSFSQSILVLSASETFSRTKQESTTENITKTTGTQITDQTGEQVTKNKGISTSDSQGVSSQIKFENKSVKEILGRIDKQLKRVAASESYGMWNCAAYFISNARTTVIKLADLYKGQTNGKDSGLESSAINVWKASDANLDIFRYLFNMSHPCFIYQSGAESKPLKLTPGSLVSSEELAIHLSFPQKSIPGMIVKEQAPFGRNVPKTEKDHIELGCIEHLDHSEEDNPVKLDIESLAKHTFITGTTGSGKSNTVYYILNSLLEQGIPFLVIESAKGEYKDVFSDKDVKVYGSNPLKTPLLKINPFSFPDDIHVLEHIDRIVEIFNVCWPMYAAMPAVLKESIVEAYKSCGWDLINSKNQLKLFPTFEDVLFELKDIINKSEYSADTQGDYKGALETRLRSLTNGIFGQMFVAEEIGDEILFTHSTIIDLSRIGSSETKSMIMGLLIMKLNEYRMAENKGMNLPLRHVTVLEEAHNLLKRTSKEQSSESANIAGKSVEMIANSIAEMRTYGEGFIIADQSPAMLDEAAIRNTNTKIIMALPDKNDREYAGKSVGLKEQQIEEITMLSTGVGVVYQNSWQEAVLCKIKKYETSKSKYHYELAGEIANVRLALFKSLINIYQNNTFETVDNIKETLFQSNISGRILYRLFFDFEDMEDDDDLGGKCVCDEDAAKVFTMIMGIDSILKVQNIKNTKKFNKQLLQLLKNKLNKEEQALFNSDLLLNMYIQGCEQCSDDMFYQEWKKLSYGK